MSDDASRLPAKVASTAATSTAVAFLAHSPEMAATAATLAPVTEFVMVRAADRAYHLLAEVRRSIRKSPDELVELMASDWRAEQLVLDGIEAAQRTADQAKFRQLASAVSRGLTDEAFLDTAVQLVVTMRSLDPAHAAVLRTMVDEANPEQGNRREGEWTSEQLGTRLPSIGPSLTALIGTLVSTGCIVAGVGIYADLGVGVWSATPYGRLALEHMRSSGVTS